MIPSFSLFFKSVGLGLAIAAPVGPIGLLCISQTLRHTFFAGLAVGIGAALADATFGLITGLGVQLLMQFFIRIKIFLHLLGGALLCFFGFRELHKGNFQQTTPARERFFFSIVGSSFLLTLTNPMTIFIFVGIFSSLGIDNFSHSDILVTVLGLFIGSMIWWLFLASIVSLTRTRLPLVILTRINRLSGIILTLFGLFAIGVATLEFFYAFNTRHTIHTVK